MSTNTAAISSLIFSDGFDYYNNLLTKWTSAANISSVPGFVVPGRFGYGQCIEAGSENSPSIYKAFPNGPYTRLVMGVAVNLNAGYGFPGQAEILGFIDSQANYIDYLTIDQLGRIGFAGLSSNPVAIPVTAWAYIEIDVIFSTSSTGSFMIAVNGQTVLQGSNLATSTVAPVYGIFLGRGIGDVSYDDLYVLAPTSSTVGDSFLGDIKIVALLPNGNGRLNQFTQTGGVSGQHWTAVDDTTPDGDNSYMSSNTVGQVQDFTLPTPSTVTPVSAVYGVSCYALARKDDSPARFLSIGVGNGTTDYYDAGSALGSTYNYVQRVMPTNPITGLPWTLTDFNNLQIGVKLIS